MSGRCKHENSLHGLGSVSVDLLAGDVQVVQDRSLGHHIGHGRDPCVCPLDEAGEVGRLHHGGGCQSETGCCIVFGQKVHDLAGVVVDVNTCDQVCQTHASKALMLLLYHVGDILELATNKGSKLVRATECHVKLVCIHGPLDLIVVLTVEVGLHYIIQYRSLLVDGDTVHDGKSGTIIPYAVDIIDLPYVIAPSDIISFKALEFTSVWSVRDNSPGKYLRDSTHQVIITGLQADIRHGYKILCIYRSDHLLTAGLLNDVSDQLADSIIG